MPKRPCLTIREGIAATGSRRNRRGARQRVKSRIEQEPSTGTGLHPATLDLQAKAEDKPVRNAGGRMNEIAQALTSHELLARGWRLAVWACAAYLLALGALAFLHPPVVHRFFNGLAASWGNNFLEAILRLIVGLAFMAVSPDTRLPLLFFWFGAALAITAIPMMFLYRLHKRLAAWVIPLSKRVLPLMGIVAIALAGLIVWATT